MKASFANMKLKVNTSVKTFEFGGQQIEVLQYLPVRDKYDLLMSALQKSYESGIYNELKLDVYFNLNLVYLYSNISFTEKQREDELKIYDVLESNGFFDAFLANFNKEEYDTLFEQLIAIKEASVYYKTSAAALLQSVITDLPASAEAAAKIVNEFEPSKFQAVVDFATAANGGRNIVTNK